MEPGDLVFRYSAAKGKMGHVGVYVGNGMVIEAQGRDAGVVMRHLSYGGWTHQGRHPALAEDTAPTVFRLTSPMMRGENVKLMQAALTAYGYSLAMRLILIGHRMTPALERVVSDAMQTLDIEDMDEPKKVSNPTAKAGGLW